MAVLFTMAMPQFFDENGAPLAGGKLYSYEAGTTTPKDTYTTQAGTVAQSNPIVLDSSGFIPVSTGMWIEGSYKFKLTDSNDVEIWTIDNVTSFSTLTESSSTTTAPPTQNKLAPAENLVIYRGSATAITINATSVTLKNSSGDRALFSSLSQAVSITTSGAGGLDAGSEASSTWYHIWAIGKTDGTKSAVFSTSTSAPTLPSGYTYYGYLGAVYNDSSGDLVSFRQLGNRVTVAVQTGVSAGTATTFTAIDLAQEVPSTATAVQFEYGVSTSSGTATASIVVAAYGSGTAPTYGYCKHTQVTSSTTATYGNASLVFNTAQELYYYVSGANARGYVDIIGWWY